MEKTKVKNVIIIILLAVNIFFLALFLIGRAETGKLKKQAHADVIAILSENKINVSESALPEDFQSCSFKLTRDINGETLITKTVLGDTDTSLDGSVYHYESLAGRAEFHGSGEFSIAISNGFPVGDGRKQDIIDFFKSISISVDPGSVSFTGSGSSQTVSCLCTHNGAAVFNCEITLTISEGRIYYISGRRPTSAALASGPSSSSGVSTALLSFLSGVRAQNIKVHEITSISPGYYMSAAASGGGGLYPVWRLATDAGEYYVNGITGAITAMAN